jgi:hypothetical protein
VTLDDEISLEGTYYMSTNTTFPNLRKDHFSLIVVFATKRAFWKDFLGQ